MALDPVEWPSSNTGSDFGEGDSENGNVILLAASLRGAGDFRCRFSRESGCAFKAEQFAVRVACLDNAAGIPGKADVCRDRLNSNEQMVVTVTINEFLPQRASSLLAASFDAPYIIPRGK